MALGLLRLYRKVLMNCDHGFSVDLIKEISGVMAGAVDKEHEQIPVEVVMSVNSHERRKKGLLSKVRVKSYSFSLD